MNKPKTPSQNQRGALSKIEFRAKYAKSSIDDSYGKNIEAKNAHFFSKPKYHKKHLSNQLKKTFNKTNNCLNVKANCNNNPIRSLNNCNLKSNIQKYKFSFTKLKIE